MSRLLPIVVLSLSALLAACEGSDGADGAAGPAGTNGSAGTPGGDGLNSLTTLTAEPAGLICTSGGQRIDTGLDDDRDGVLDAAEIDQTSYVCSNNVATLYATEVRGDLCLHGATLLKSGLDTNDNDILDAGEVLSTATICQNNAAPTFRLREYGYFGLPPTYDAANRRYSFVRYARPGSDLYLYSDDGNDDPVTITYGAHADVDFIEFDPASTFPEADDPAHAAEAGLRVMIFDTLPVGVHDLPMQVSDGEASITYTLRDDARDPGWAFTPLLAQEGVDDYAEGTVTMAVPTLMNLMVEAAVPGLEVCVDGQPCLPTLTVIEFCEDGYPPGDPVGCVVYYDINPVSIPAGTTSFTVRRAIADDASWGNGTGLAMSMRLVTESGSFGLDWLDDFFIVLDNDTAPTVTFIDTLLTLPSGQFGSLLFQSSLADVWIPFTFSGTAVSGVDYTTTAHVLVDGTGAGTLDINTLLDEAMSGDLLLNIAFDTVYGLITGAEPSATVTITPPAELALSFAGATSSISRYEPFYCVDVELNRVSYIATVSFDVVLGGTAIDPDDYAPASGTGPVTIEPGQTIHSICFNGSTLEQAADRTVAISLANLAGAAAGANPGHTLTLAGAPFPTLDFAAATSSAMTDVAVDTDCVSVTLSGTVPVGRIAEFTLRATLSNPDLQSMVESGGFYDDAGTQTYYGYFTDGSAGSQDICFSRPALAVAPAGDHTVTFELAVDGAAHLGTTQTTTTLEYRQDYGLRVIAAPQIENGSWQPLQTIVAGDGAAGRFGWIDGQIVGGTDAGNGDVTLQYLAVDGTLAWQRQYGGVGVDDVMEAAGDDDGDMYFLVDHYADYVGGTRVGGTLYRVDTAGATSWSKPWARGHVLAARGDVLVVTDQDAGTLSAIDATGTVLWSKHATDFGLTGCLSQLHHFRALPIAATGDWMVVVIPGGGGCTLPDVDLDTVVHNHLFARVGANGTIAWRIDDTDELGATALLAGNLLEARVDAVGNLYLTDRAQVMRVTTAGALSWAAEAPAPAGAWSSYFVGFDVSPAGASAVAWQFLQGTFGGLLPLGGQDIGVGSRDSAGAATTLAVVGGVDDDVAGWVLASDDGLPLVRMAAGWEGGGVFRIESPDVRTLVDAQVSPGARPTRLLDGDIAVVDATAGQVTRHSPAFERR